MGGSDPRNAKFRHKCDSEVERLRREHATSAPSSRSASPTAPASLPAEEGACKRSDKAILTCAEECAGWCRQEQMTAAQGRAKELCGDEVGKAVAAERKRLQERALKSRRRAIEKVLQGNHSGNLFPPWRYWRVNIKHQVCAEGCNSVPLEIGDPVRVDRRCG